MKRRFQNVLGSVPDATSSLLYAAYTTQPHQHGVKIKQTKGIGVNTFLKEGMDEKKSTPITFVLTGNRFS